MRYWDSSALVPLILQQESSAKVRQWLKEDPVILVWWHTEIECASALARIERQSKDAVSTINKSWTKLHQLASLWQVIQPIASIKEQSIRLLRVHDLRAADAAQLAAAIVASEYRTSSLEFACLDDRLAKAAQKEGFILVG